MSKTDLTKAVTCFVVVCLIGITSTVVYAASPPAEVQQAAEEGLAHFLTTVPLQELARMGLPSAAEVQAATLGSPYEQFTLTPEALSSYQPGAALAPLVTGTDTWLFPVMVDGEARTMLTVGMVNGKWEAGDIGGTDLPAALQQAEANLAGLLAQKGITAAYTTQFVRVFQAQADLLLVSAKGAEYLLPLMANPEAYSLTADTLFTPDQVIPQFKALTGEPGASLNAPGGGGMEPSLGAEEIAAPAQVEADTSSTKAGEVALVGADSTSANANEVAAVAAETDNATPNRSSTLLYVVGLVAALALVAGGSAVLILRKGRQV